MLELPALGEQEKATRAKAVAFENKGLKRQVEKEGVQAVLRKQALVEFIRDAVNTWTG